jgi:Fe-S cluster assembly protein SufB
MKEKTYVEDIDRNIYDFKDEEKDAYRINAGLTPEIKAFKGKE